MGSLPRRAVVVGLASTPAVVIDCAEASQTAFSDLFAKWRAAADESDRLTKLADEAYGRMTRIQIPTALYLRDEDGPYLSSLAVLRHDGLRWYGEHQAITCLKALKREMEEKGVSQVRVDRIVSGYDEWCAAVAAEETQTGFKDLDERRDQLVEITRELARQIAATPVHSLPDLLRKAEVVRWCYVDASLLKEELEEEIFNEGSITAEVMLLSIATDLCRIGGADV